MGKTCYRCSTVEKRGVDYKNLLFLSPIFLSSFEEWKTKENEYELTKQEGKETRSDVSNGKNYKDGCGEEHFYEYVKKKREENNDDFDKTYKEIYLNFYSCEKCCGLHNIDIILFHNRDNPFYLKLLKTLTNVEEKMVRVVSEIVQKHIYNNILTNIDIILFFLYLEKNKINEWKTSHMTKEINTDSQIKECKKEDGSNVPLELLNDTFEIIKSYIVIHVNLVNTNIKQSIYKLFVFVLLYVYYKFYQRIYAAVNLKTSHIQVLSKLFKNTKLIWTVELEELVTDMDKNDHKNENTSEDKDENINRGFNKTKFSKRGKYTFRRKKKRLNDIDSGKDTVYEQMLKSCKNRPETEKGTGTGKETETETGKETETGTGPLKSIDIDKEETAKTENVEEEGNEHVNVTGKDCYKNCTRIRFVDVYISYNKLCICGSYNKYNKNISQTKWIINQVSKSATSIEECVSEIFRNVFCFSSATFIGSGREDKDVRMMNTGRPFVLVLNETRFSLLNFYLFFKKLTELQDSDISHIQTVPELKNTLSVCLCDNVRDRKDEQRKDRSQDSGILKNMYALINRKDTSVLYDVEESRIVFEENQAVICKEKRLKDLQISTSCNKELEELLCNTEEEHWTTECMDKEKLTTVKKKYNINNLVEVKLNNIVFTSNYKLIKKIMHYGTERKKAYKCLIYHVTPMNKEKIQNINKDISNYENKKENEECQEKTEESATSRERIEESSQKMKNRDYVLKIFQKTPVRVLHRRSLLIRERKIYEIQMVSVHPHCSLLYILAESGLYIKEFVSGDRGRTFPNLKHFFNNTYVNVLNLDVSKLVYT